VFTAEPPATTTLIPFATSTPVRHPIYAMAEEPQQPVWKTPERAAPIALAPKAAKRLQQHGSDIQDAHPAKRKLFGDNDEMPGSSPQQQKTSTNDDGGKWPSLADENAANMTDSVSEIRADRCTVPDIP
jgi:hypothetical protein